MFRSPPAALAAVQVLCALVLAGFFVIQSAQTQQPPLLLGAVIALVGFGFAAYRNYRRAEQQRAAQESGPLGGWSGPARPLSSDDDARLARTVGVLDRAGLFAPRLPDPDHLTEAVADAGGVTAGTVLDALHEAGHHHREFRFEDHTAALACHATQVEQDVEALRAQVADLARLLDGALDVRADDVRVGDDGVVEVDLVLGGTPHPLCWLGRPKALSTVLHVTVARAAAGGRRLAWLWTDQHVWLGVPRIGVVTLNGKLDAPPHERWAWVDEQEPVAAGEV